MSTSAEPAIRPGSRGEPERPPLLQLKDVTLRYTTRDHRVTATYKVGFDVDAGDRFVILGASGCGKSTLLKAIGGFMRPAAGLITLNGRPVTKPGPDRVMVFQDFEQLMPWKTVRENVMFPIRVTGKFRGAEAARQVDEAIERVKLTRFGHLFPHMLSGGMKMRVALARALALEPDILLMDEPFAALDALTRREMQEDLLRLWAQLRFTLLFVTHSIDEAIIVGSRVLVLSPHPGRVRAEIDVERFGFDALGREDFGRVEKRIHQLLFESASGHDGAQLHA